MYTVNMVFIPFLPNKKIPQTILDHFNSNRVQFVQNVTPVTIYNAIPSDEISQVLKIFRYMMSVKKKKILYALDVSRDSKIKILVNKNELNTFKRNSRNLEIHM